jgi:hypothetical protein
LDRRLGGPQRRSGRGGEEKSSQPPPGIELQNPDRPILIIKTRLEEVEYEQVNWIHVTEHRAQWLPLVLAVLNQRISFDICDRSNIAIAGSNPIQDVDALFCAVLSLRWADPMPNVF